MSSHLLHYAVPFLLQSLAMCSGIPYTKMFPFLCPFFNQASLLVTLNNFDRLCLCAVLSWNFCSLFLNSVQFVLGLKLFCITNFAYHIGGPLRTKPMMKVSETTSHAPCSLVSSSCPLMKKLFNSSESSSCFQDNCTNEVTTIVVSKL